MTTTPCLCADVEIHAQALQSRQTGGWLAAALALLAALVAGLAALSPLTGPVCAPVQAPKGDAAYADVLTTRNWNAAIASESRLSLAPARVRAAC